MHHNEKFWSPDYDLQKEVAASLINGRLSDTNVVRLVVCEITIMNEEESSETRCEPATRKVSWLLAVGIVILPLIFVWFLLRSGYGNIARAAGFSWAGLILLGLIFSPSPSDQTEKGSIADGSNAPIEARSEASVANKGKEDAKSSEEAAVESNVPRPLPLSEGERKGLHCLSSWDGSHRGIKTFVRDRLRDPSSFDHVETRILPIDNQGEHRLVMTYRAKNGFGGTNVERALARITNGDCSLIDVQM